jgi:hypothetical protein
MKINQNIFYTITILSMLATRCAPATENSPVSPYPEPVPSIQTLSPDQIKYLGYFKQGMELPNGIQCIGDPGEPEQTSINGRLAETYSLEDGTKGIRVDMPRLESGTESFPEEYRELYLKLVGGEEFRHYCEIGDMIKTGHFGPIPSEIIGSVLIFKENENSEPEIFYGLTEAISNSGAALHYKDEGSFEFFDRFHDHLTHYVAMKLFQRMVDEKLVDFNALQNELYNADPNMQLKGINRLTNSVDITDSTDISNVITTKSGTQIPKITALWTIFSQAEEIDPRYSLDEKRNAIDFLFEKMTAVIGQ